MTRQTMLLLALAAGMLAATAQSPAWADRYTSQQALYPPPAKADDEPPLPDINSAEKAYLVRLAKKALEHAVKTGKAYEPADVPESLQKKDYLVFVSARLSGRMVDSAGGDGGGIATNVAAAALAIAGDDQFRKDKLAAVADSVIEINILGPGQLLPFPRVDQIAGSIAPGIHGLAARTGKKTICFKESVAPIHGFTGEIVMRRLLEKAGWTVQQVVANRAKITFFRFRAMHLLERPNENGYVELMRCSELVGQETVTAERLNYLVDLIGRYMCYRQLDSGLFSYLYSPATGNYVPGDNAPRQAGAAWSLAKLARETGNPEYELASLKAIAAAKVRYLDDAKTAACVGYAFEPGKQSLGATGLLLCAMIDVPNNKPLLALRDKIAAGIIGQQRKDGSLKLYFDDRQEDDNRFYYPGEALLALMKMHQQTGEKKYLDCVERSFQFYHGLFQTEPQQSFTPWQIQAWSMAYDATNKKEYADFVFQMGDYIVGFQADESASVYPDMIGAFVGETGRGGIGTAAYTEGVVAAHRLAVKVGDARRAQKYAMSLRRAARFLDQLTFKHTEAFYCVAPKEVVGGVKSTPNDHSIRIDNCQHALLALMGIRQELFGTPFPKVAPK